MRHLFTLIVPALLFFAAWHLEQPPRAKPTEAPFEEFSAHRALRLIRDYAVQPHRAGTAANDALRLKLIDALKALGLSVVTEEPTVCRGNRVGNPRNIYARLPGRHSQLATTSSDLPESELVSASATMQTASDAVNSIETPTAFLLMAHYDSVPYGPGAADDLAGVAAILEAVRAITAGPPLENDLVIAFTDGEECGLLGAKAFSRHPWAKTIGCMLNFEARGVCGPSYLFELGAPKAWLVQEMARSGAPLRTSSLMFDVYRRLPFSTDYHMLRDTIPGMNAAFIGHFPYYHSADDTVDHLDPDSLQHHGEYALAFARHFGSMTFPASQTTSDLVWFTCGGSMLVHYSSIVSISLSLLLLALGVLVLRTRDNDTEAVFFGSFALSTTENGSAHSTPSPRLVLKAIVNTCLLAGFSACIPAILGFFIRGPYLLYANWWFILSGLIFSTVVAIAVHKKYRSQISACRMHKGYIAVWMFFLTAFQVFVPSGVFLWQWILFSSVFSFHIMLFLFRNAVLYSIRLVLFVLNVVVITAISAPFFYGIGEAIGVFSLPFIGFWTVLTAGLCLPWLDDLLLTFNRKHALIALAATLLCLAYAIAASSPSIYCPRMTHLLCDIDADTQRLRWCSLNVESDSHPASLFSGEQVWGALPEAPEKILRQSSPVLSHVSGPVAQLVGESPGSETPRLLTIQITPTKSAARLLLNGSSTAQLTSIAIDHCPLEIRGNTWNIDYSILAGRPVLLTCSLAEAASLTLRLTEIRYELPDNAPRRPPGVTVMNNVLNRGSRLESDTVRVRAQFVF